MVNDIVVVITDWGAKINKIVQINLGTGRIATHSDGPSHCRRAKIVQPYLPGGANVHFQLIIPRAHTSQQKKNGNITSVGWQVTLYDPIWYVNSRSGKACC